MEEEKSNLVALNGLKIKFKIVLIVKLLSSYILFILSLYVFSASSEFCFSILVQYCSPHFASFW